jgi:hypothetical protein
MPTGSGPTPPCRQYKAMIKVYGEQVLPAVRQDS